MINSPPYCGFPSLSHQLPFVLAVVVVDLEVCIAVVVAIGIDAVVTAVVDVVVLVAIVVDVVQDAKTSDVTMRQVNAIQVVPIFISSSYNLMENFWKID